MTETIPADFDMLTADNCCALLIDHQPGLYFQQSDFSNLTLKNNTVALAKVLALHEIPTVISCAAQGPAGPMGPLLPEIAELFPDVEPIYRTKINSWQDDDIRGAIEATGRKKVIGAGITADFCIGLPAKNMAAEGYDVRLVTDASGTDSSVVLHSTIANLTQHGVKVCGWIAVAMELLGDWARPEMAEDSLAIYRDHNPSWGFLETIQTGFRSAAAA
jgi:nicotinamidase-related amidase